MISSVTGRAAVLLISMILMVQVGVSQPVDTLRLGYFEGGKYPLHQLLRREFDMQLRYLLGPQRPFVFIPTGFRSAEWNRDTCRSMAGELTGVGEIDMMITMGPWVVEDLLAAGFSRPIIAMYRYAPHLEGLVDTLTMRPIAENLTVHVKSGRIEADLRSLARLLEVRNIGVLYFPSDEESGLVFDRMRKLGGELGFEIVSAEGYDNEGTYAFFNAYRNLDRGIDALYLPPLWGMDHVKIFEFFKAVARDGIPTFSSEGTFAVENAALASNAGYTLISEALFSAFKAKRIADGEKPADLPVVFQGETGLALSAFTADTCGIELPIDLMVEAYTIPSSPPTEVERYSPLTAVRRALSMNPGYQARYEALDAGRRARQEAWSGLLPQFKTYARAFYFDDNTVHNHRNEVDNSSFTAGFTLHQPLFSLPSIKELRVAARQEDLQASDVRRAQLDLETGVVLAYLDYSRALELLNLHRRNRNLIDRALEAARARTALEIGNEWDTWRLESARHQATADLAGAEANLRVAQISLNALFNLPGDVPFDLDTGRFAESKIAYDYEQLYPLVSTEDERARLLEFLVTTGLENNPHLQRQEAIIGVNQALIAGSKAGFLPEVSLVASLRLGDSLRDTDTFEEEFTSWSVGGQLEWPLFLGGKRYYEKARLEARVSEAEYEWDAISLEVMQTIRTEAEGMVTNLLNLPAAIRATESARLCLDGALPDYEGGQVSAASFLDVQQALLQAERRSIETRYAYLASLARVVHAAGWTTHENATTFRQEFFRQIRETLVAGG